METAELTPEDLARLESRGISRAEAEAQMDVLRKGQAYAALERPCTLGDGIERWTPEERDRHAEAYLREAEAGRALQFVPASGAATRMFKGLQAVLNRRDLPDHGSLRRAAESGDADARETLAWWTDLEAFPFREELAADLSGRGLLLEALLRAGDYRPALEALLRPDRLGYGDRPKALIPFHAYEDGPRTALEEHLAEAADLVRDADGLCRLHVTVSPAHRAAFERALEEIIRRRATNGLRYQVGLSVQDPATDTLATDADGRPFRDKDGSLVLRPGGHGALLANLESAGGDLVFLKNIDNVVPDALRAPLVQWRRALAGRLARLRAESFRHLEALRRPRDAAAWERPEEVELLEAAARFVEGSLGTALPPALRTRPADAAGAAAKRDYLAALLDRPLRVCGVVEDRGEPGGGPFWVRHADGSARLQIVESPQVDAGSEEQRRRAKAATHFSPTDLVCAVRNARGEPYRLRDFVDPSACFVTEKSREGRPLRALERPGLWNGSMAHWNTVFVEIPVEAFNPVKTVLDLLRPAHRGVPATAA